mgnify:CR=1 FL=1
MNIIMNIILNMFELVFFQDPLNVDLVINLMNDGIKLIFDHKFS